MDQVADRLPGRHAGQIQHDLRGEPRERAQRLGLAATSARRRCICPAGRHPAPAPPCRWRPPRRGPAPRRPPSAPVQSGSSAQAPCSGGCPPAWPTASAQGVHRGGSGRPPQLLSTERRCSTQPHVRRSKSNAAAAHATAIAPAACRTSYAGRSACCAVMLYRDASRDSDQWPSHCRQAGCSAGGCGGRATAPPSVGGWRCWAPALRPSCSC